MHWEFEFSFEYINLEKGKLLFKINMILSLIGTKFDFLNMDMLDQTGSLLVIT